MVSDARLIAACPGLASKLLAPSVRSFFLPAFSTLPSLSSLSTRFCPLSALLPSYPKAVSMHLSSACKTLLWSTALASLATATVGNCPGTAIHGRPFPPLIEATLDDLSRGLSTGLFTSVDLVNAYTARILEVNATVHAVTELNPDALAIAAQLDLARARGRVKGPLHGIPILLKNVIATADKLGNTAGSYALLGAKVPEDSSAAAKLRNAGAIILGKANLSQWVYFRSFNTSEGWSAIGGQTMGAYYPEQEPSGSSSGSAVAASLGLAPAALGTETVGSLVEPGSVNNVVAIKPTVGLVSRYLTLGISERMDTIGPLAGTVKDAAYILSAIAGRDPKDNYTSAIPFHSIPNYAALCSFGALRGKRIGVPRNLIGGSQAAFMEPAFSEALDLFRRAGATVVDNITLPGFQPLNSGPYVNIVLADDYVSNLNKSYMSKLVVNPNNIHSVPDLITFTHNTPAEQWPLRDTGIWESIVGYTATQPVPPNSGPDYWTNFNTALDLAGPQGITGALANYSLDALVVPSPFSPVMPAALGSPIVTVPLGRFPDDAPVVRNGFGNLNVQAPNLPFGLSFMAERFSEEKLIGLAYAFEQRTQVRNTIEPYIQPTTELVDIVKQRTGHC